MSNAAEARQDIMKLLDQLPEKQRMPIIHTKLDGLSVEEAAQKTRDVRVGPESRGTPRNEGTCSTGGERQ
jgi:hypothetical protein